MKKVLLFVFMFLVSINVQALDKVVYFGLGNNERIIIDVDNNLKVNLYTIAGQNQIDITNIGEYKSIFLGGDKERYPTYIVKDGNTYTFSNTRKNMASNYIVSSRMYNISSSLNSVDISSCDKLLGYKFINLLKNNVFKIIYYAIPVILVVLSIWDFTKLVFTDDKEGVLGAFRKLLKRALASVLIFLVPTILIFLTNLLVNDEVKSCINTFKTTENVSENK